jgi:hypothetical protein
MLKLFRSFALLFFAGQSLANAACPVCATVGKKCTTDFGDGKWVTPVSDGLSENQKKAGCNRVQKCKATGSSFDQGCILGS